MDQDVLPKQNIKSTICETSGCSAPVPVPIPTFTISRRTLDLEGPAGPEFGWNLEHGSSGCLSCTSDEAWIISYLIDHLKQHLATYTEVITNREGKTAKVRIYYDQAFQLLKIGAYNPAPPYIIQFFHFTSRLQTELDQLDDIDRTYVMKQAVSRIFEDINLELYHNSISRVLKVVLKR
jgi:hypothetical protein